MVGIGGAGWSTRSRISRRGPTKHHNRLEAHVKSRPASCLRSAATFACRQRDSGAVYQLLRLRPHRPRASIMPTPLAGTLSGPFPGEDSVRAALLTCDYCLIATDTATLSFAEPHREVNRVTPLWEALAVSRPWWEPRSCPPCAEDHGATCRTHRLTGLPPQEGRQNVAWCLPGLQRRP